MSSPGTKIMKVDDCPTEPPAVIPNERKIHPIRTQQIHLNAKRTSQHISKRIQAKNLSFLAGQGDNKRALKMLSVALKSTKKIQKLEIYSGVSYEKSDAGFSCVAQSLRGLRSLVGISLNLPRNQYFTDVGLNYLGHALRSLVSSLRSFDLNVQGCPLISDGGIKKLSQGLRRLPELQDIHLNFKGEEGVGDEAMESICEALEKMICLKSLDLSFEECHKLTDKGVETLGETLETLTSLQRLKLNISGCREIYDEGVESIAQGINGLTSLRDVDMSLQGCYGVTDTPIKRLGQAFKTLTSVETMKLDFTYCEELTDIGIKSIGQGLKNLHSLTLVVAGLCRYAHSNFSPLNCPRNGFVLA